MKKVVSMFMALVMTFAMGPVVVARAEDECIGDACRLGPDAPNTVNSTNSTGWTWCKENLKGCAVYSMGKALNGTKWLGGKAKDAIVGVAESIRDHNYTQTWEDIKNHNYTQTWENIKNYNYTQGFETAKENIKWAASEASDKLSNTVVPWISEKVDDAAKFEKQVEDFYNYNLNNQPKWTFWTLLISAGVGVLTIGTWAFNLITCCGCGRCRLRMP